MARRYHYDAKGKLKGISSDKPLFKKSSVLMMFMGVALLIAINKAFKDDEPVVKEEQVVEASVTEEEVKEAPVVVEPVVEPVISEVVETTPSPAPTVVYPVAQQPEAPEPALDQPGYERDLKPYYEQECAKGDQTACLSLEIGDRSIHTYQSEVIGQ